METAILGLGIIGSAWARNLAEDGRPLRCWNRTPKEIPGVRRTIPEAVEGAEAVIVVVSAPPAVGAVLEEALPCLGAGQVLIQASTISAAWTLRFAEAVARTGARYVEAPFTGSKTAAEQRRTVFYVGGDREALAAAHPALDPLSNSILHVGPLGTASTLKLALNLNLAQMAQAIAESLTLSRAAGIPDEVFFAALGLNVGRSGLSDLKEPKWRSRDYSPQFSLKHMAKDLGLALETASEFGLDLAQTGRLVETYRNGLQAGWQDDDFVGLIRELETCTLPGP